MVPVSLGGNFQLKRLGQSYDSRIEDPCEEIVNVLWKANTDVGSSRYKVSIKTIYKE